MRQKLLSILALLLMAVAQSAWAQTVNCLPSDIGKVLGTDGKVYATVSAAGGLDKVSGMIAYVNTSTNKGIAIGPADLYYNSNEGSGKSPVSTAITACSNYNRTRPSAATTGWRLPSQADFNNMIGANGCQSANNLRNMIGRQASSCGCDAMKTDEGYWSSTESSSGSGIYYNLWSNSCTAIADGTNEKYFRPCFSFNVTPSYTVSYNANGGSGSVASQTKWQGTNLTLASSGFTKTGYTLDGWATSSSSAKVYDLGGTYTANAGATLYAHWSINSYTITFNTNGGSAIAAITQNYGTSITAPANPTKDGYTFAGWDKAIPSTMPAENMTITAQWTAIASYNVPANSASEAYWATFYSNAGNYQAPEGTQVFTVSLAGTGITMNEVSDRIAKSGEGVVLKKTTTGNFTMTLTETAPAGDFSSNNLTGTMTSITNPGNAYVLGGTNGAGFYKLKDTGTIGANKAYLTYSGGGGAGAREFFLFDEATGIEMPTVEDVNADDVFYDLQGRRVATPAKGLYIVNGKKVMVK